MTRALLTTLFAAAVGAQAAHAQPADARAAMLVSTTELAAALDGSNLVLLHVGDKAEYDAAHIPGARYVSLRDLSVAEGKLVLQMPGADDLKSRLEALGISDDSRVVVYFGKDWISPATRVVFTIAHAGLDRVALLDGGMPAWAKAGHPVTDALPAPRAGTLTRLAPRADIADAAFVQKNLGRPGFALIDARDAEFYNGTREGGPRDLRMAGHIAGAISVPFSSVATAGLTLKPRAELEAIFSNAGVKPGDTVVTYCHIGQQATAVLFAARSLGYKVLLYDGSFEDWVRRGLAVRNPAKQ